MNFHNLRDFEENQIIEADICIIGSGPAGLSIAGEFASTDQRVWVIESGGHGTDAKTQKLYQYENVGVQRCESQDFTRIRSYGGTSALWAGRLASYDEMDFKERDWVDYSGWPVSKEELSLYFDRAGEILNLGPHIYDEGLWDILKAAKPEPELNKKFLISHFWQFARSRKVDGEPTRCAKDFTTTHSDNIDILLFANLVHINTESTGDADSPDKGTSIDITTLEGKKAKVTATIFILCCGGVENARLLLASNKILKHGVGNQNDMVGRFFTDHPYCDLGLYDVKKSRALLDRFSHFWIDDEKGRHVYLHGLMLARELQKDEKLLNCTAYLVHDYDVDSSLLRAKRAVMSLKSGKINLNLFKDILSVKIDTHRIIDLLIRRYFKNRPPIISTNRLALGCNVEQKPDPESRVMLSEKKVDMLGMPLAKIDWKMSDEELHTIKRVTELIDGELTKIGMPKLKVVSWLKNNDKNWRDNFFDSSHHMGSTRMSDDPKLGVVDRNLKVHGVQGLYVAGSSIFPTAGTANPMLMIVSFSIRLADHLKKITQSKSLDNN